MKTILSLLFALTLGTAFGQFIPQPMGYNPDVNGDEFIGVDDVMGTLALYNSPFDNGDSVEVGTIFVGGEQISLTLPEDLDLVYIELTPHDGSDYLYKYFGLPGGTGFKVLQVFVRNQGLFSVDVGFGDEQLDDLFNNVVPINFDTPRFFTFIRGHNGHWYSSPRE